MTPEMGLRSPNVRTVWAEFTSPGLIFAGPLDAVFTNDLISNVHKDARGEPVSQGKG
jgi:hypothetical protein